MSVRIEDLALIGDLHTAALVSTGGTIVWLCLPRFESDACFASLLGDESNGCWTLGPAAPTIETHRRYRQDSLVLETTFRTAEGSVRIVDFMPRRDRLPVLIRIVEGLEGRMAMQTKVAFRFDYGSMPPWTRRIGDAVTFTVEENAAALRSSVQLEIDEPDAHATFSVAAGDCERFVLQWYPSWDDPPEAIEARDALDETESLWRHWAGDCGYRGPYRDAVVRSLITLKALTYEPTGGCIAAPTTSIPEQIAGSWNWDYRFAWIRDSAITIDALVPSGYFEEARSWRDWLLRALAGAPEHLQIMYMSTGHARIEEYEVPWLAGYENSKPVRIGNAAYKQFQLGIYGHLMQSIVAAHDGGIAIDSNAWKMLQQLLEFLDEHWRDPDSGIWEYREKPRFYTHSRIMAWLAFQCAIHVAEDPSYEGPLERWRATAAAIHDEVCEKGFDPKQNAFIQSYGSTDLDASLLAIPMVGFLPAGDPRVRGTIAAIERNLTIDGFVMRASRNVVDGKPNEGSFLACDFWLVQAYALSGRTQEARHLFERLLALCNDVGLLSEEYDLQRKRLVGNFPQTFSHATLVNAALAIEDIRDRSA